MSRRPNPIDGFSVDHSDISSIGYDLQCPECIMVSPPSRTPFVSRIHDRSGMIGIRTRGLGDGRLSPWLRR